MERGRHEHEHDDERVERLVARLRALDAPAPERLRAAVEQAVAEAERAGCSAREPAASDTRAARAGGGDADGSGSAATARPHRRRRPFALAAAAAAGLALVALLLVLVLPVGDGGQGEPSVPQVAAVALQAPDRPAPRALPQGRLDVEGDGVPFPDWSAPAAGGWRATGTRSDRVGDRDVTTVRYEDDGGRQLGYAIAAAPQLPIGGRYVDHDGEHMWVYEVDGATAVMWLRDGRTCVVAARDVPEEALLDLAASYSA